MLDYDATTQLYLVKRVEIPSELQECEKETLSRQSQRSTIGERKPKKKNRADLTSPRHGSKLELANRADSPDTKTGISPGSNLELIPGSRSNIKLERPKMDSGSNAGPNPVTGSGEKSKPVSGSGSRENIIIADAVPVPGGGGKVATDANGPKVESPTGKGAVKSLAQRPSALNGIKMKEGGLESENGTYYWVPRVRVLFAAEDPRVFANRVSYAHMSRSAKMKLAEYVTSSSYDKCSYNERVQTLLITFT